MELGTPTQVLNEVQKQHTRSASTYLFPLNTAENVAIHIYNYFDNGSDFSMNGASELMPNSLFILKGNRSILYGYLVLHDNKKADEITTRNGLVSMDEISISKIFSDPYGSDLRPFKQEGSLIPDSGTNIFIYGQASGGAYWSYNNEDVTNCKANQEVLMFSI